MAQSESGFTSSRAIIAIPSQIGRGVDVYGPAQIGPYTLIGNYVAIGYPFGSELQRAVKYWKGQPSIDIDSLVTEETIIGRRNIIELGTIVCSGSRLGSDVQCESYSFIGSKTTIGNGTWLVQNAKVYDRVKIGEKCIISGFVGDNSTIGNNVRVLGKLIHKHKVPVEGRPEWDELSEPGPTIGDDAIIGFDSIVIGDIHIGEGAYVAAGAVVTKDVAARTRVAGNPARPMD